ncbi:GNAT family N-acetyltransferase [Actinoalloteichus hymeniacidonis]|uniref:Acetyltransferase, ribosomal protein N-acetylase n=1 Tax=Actinoalloteichus hymeniacidonis TaxID=340345 RepID=A0AAC9MVK0_9PSEU|nr:GNAT family protein [Actinoalloteichus hymeniacidonis]AOS61258.1 acetyltransferase, ribosomal protein N-acetylase [Actinoalloteichus hymeniacidonis]MBB5910739.1 RimJ/RimL family protein N-acetyltransferase [Actinoalloteichus hymeniacidonis]
MSRADVFRDQSTLIGSMVRLEPQTERHFDGIWAMLADEESKKLTGTHRTFTEDEIRNWLRTRADHHDRADWAVVRREDDRVLGEVVLNDLDPDNDSASFRIGLGGPGAIGRGHGTEATRLVLAYAFDVVGLHRLELEVFDFNTRARHVYEKCGFVVEGVRRQALKWDGERHDALVMAVLATDPRPRPAGAA